MGGTEERPPKRAWWAGVKGVLALVATLVAIVAAAVTTYLAVRNQPQLTIQDWAREANSLCDKVRGDLTQKHRDIYEGLSQLSPDIDVARGLEVIARAVEDTVDVQRGLMGDLHKIRMPNTRQTDVEATFTLADELNNDSDRFVTSLREVDPATVSVEKIAAEFDALHQEILILAGKFRILGADGCETTITG